MSFIKRIVNLYVDKPLLIFLLILFIFENTQAQSQQTQLANEYYINGEQDKALDLFEKLSRDASQIQFIHANYFALMIARGDMQTAEKYLNKVNKTFANNLQYQADLIYLYHISGQPDKKKDYLNELLSIYKQNQFQLNQLSQILSGKEMYSDAKNLLLLARQASNNSRSYALEMAALYRILDQKDLMIDEYLNYGLINNRNTNYVKNLFQMLLTEPGDFDQLKAILMDRVQRDPDELAYIELLIWINLQQKNFYGAFVQAKALDRRNAKPGDESMQVAQVAANNSAWEDAIEIYEYIIATYNKSYHYIRARQQLIEARKFQVLSNYPVDKVQIQQLIIDYQKLYDELGPSPTTFEALKEKASLLAYHMDQKNQAVTLLQTLIDNPSVPANLKDESKLLLGDIYILVNEPWEASLLYAQVQKDNKYDQLGYDARLRNARLYYFTGDFALANSYLKILKRATTKKISNNAIDLGLLITNNTILDTTDFAMKAFSAIELLNYQQKFDSSLLALQKFIESYPNHSLTDEAYYLSATMYLNMKDYDSAIKYLDLIIEQYPDDILGDDAAFNKARIMEENLNNAEIAQVLYREFLTQYPGSLYASEARKRFRVLRGDQIN